MVSNDLGEQISMAKRKSEEFKNVNAIWPNYDVVLYTGTLTAGVSFEVAHFDLSINVLNV